MKRPKTKKKVKRGYSRAFTPKNRDRAGRYLLDKIPAGLWRDAKAKAKRDGVSIRAVLLEHLTKWLEPVPEPEVLASPAPPASVEVASESKGVVADVGAEAPEWMLPPVPCAKCGGTGQQVVTTETSVSTDTCDVCQGRGVVPAVP